MEQLKSNPPITRLLLKWYEENKRELPWRGTTDPYRVWVSEVILQQTRVAQGWDYYTRFIQRFPNVEALALADEEDVLLMWQGLGYYSRARNMHFAARDIMGRFSGKFPEKYSDILSLKGIGEYTAAAIASIAFNAPHAAVDGNVLRVISRLFALTESIHTAKGKKVVTEISNSLLPVQEPAAYNQAIMDFGSMVCTPKQPRCTDCPLQEFCIARLSNRVEEFPVNTKKKSSRKRYFSYFHILHGNDTYIAQRVKEDIWKGLYEFPLVETREPVSLDELLKNADVRDLLTNDQSLAIDSPSSVLHVLSHQRIYANFYRVVLPDNAEFYLPEHFIRIQRAELDLYPIARLTGKYLESIEES